MVESGQYQRATGRLPTWYEQQPQQVRGDEIYVRAYARLSTERAPFGNQVGRIPWSAIDRYAQSYGFRGIMREWFVDLLMMLDQDYVEHVETEREKETAKKERKARIAERRAADRSGTTKSRW